MFVLKKPVYPTPTLEDCSIFVKSKTYALTFSVLSLLLLSQCEIITDGPPSKPPGDDFLAPLQYMPANAATDQKRDVVLRWSAVSNAEMYHVRLGTSRFSRSHILDTLVNSNWVSVKNLRSHTSYYWNVQAVNYDMTSPWSGYRQFVTAHQANVPETVTLDLKTPEDEALLTEEIFHFTWEETANATGYLFQLSDSRDFDSLEIEELVSDANFSTPALILSGSYFWRVIPVLSSGPSDWSTVFQADAVYSEHVPAVVLASPLDGESDVSPPLTLEWEPVSQFDEYRLQLAHSNTFGDPVLDDVVIGNSFTIDDLDTEQTYFWRVKIAGNGNSEWSEKWEFHTAQASSPVDPNEFVRIENGDFVIGENIFRFAGTNAYYLPNYQKIQPGVVDNALDAFEEAGINVVRMWAFYDGYDCGYSRIDPNEAVIQTAPGVYNEQALRHLDGVIAKGKDRGIRFILALVNYWDELGGICQYNTWAGATNPGRNMAFFLENENTQKWYRDYVEMLLSRVNTITGVAYKDEPAVFAWQIMNEGRNSGADPAVLRDWYQEMAIFIKSHAPNHLVSTGEEGFDEGVPSQYSVSEYSNTYVLRANEGTSYIMNTAIPEIDFGSAHWYPQDFGFGWEPSDAMYRAQRAWLNDHSRIAADLGKPFVLGEYGYAGWGDARVYQVYDHLWTNAEDIRVDGTLLWQLTADSAKCTEFGGNICWPGGRRDENLYSRFIEHIVNMKSLTSN